MRNIVYNDLSKISVIQRSDDTARGTAEYRMIGIVLYLEKNVPRCYFVYHISHMDGRGIDGGPQLWETATNCLNHALHSFGRRRTLISVCFVIQVRWLLCLDPWSKTNYRKILLCLFPVSVFDIVQTWSSIGLFELAAGALDTCVRVRAVTISANFQASHLESNCTSSWSSVRVSGALHADLGKACASVSAVRSRKPKNHITFSSSTICCTSWISGPRCMKSDLHCTRAGLHPV